MSEQNVAVEVAVEETAKPKRVRKAPVKPKKTGAEIVEEVNTLTAQVAELEAAVSTLSEGSVIFNLANKELSAKKNELADVLDTVYTYI